VFPADQDMEGSHDWLKTPAAAIPVTNPNHDEFSLLAFSGDDKQYIPSSSWTTKTVACRGIVLVTCMQQEPKNGHRELYAVHGEEWKEK
jgi:hypothetical protein